MSYRDPHGAWGTTPPPGSPRRGSRWARRVGALLAFLAALALIAGIVAVVVGHFGGNKHVAAGKRVTVVIPKNSDGSQIARILADTGIVTSRITFSARLRVSGKGADFKAGTYSMKTGSSYDTVVAVLEKGPAPPPTFRINFPEGFRISQMVARTTSLHDKTLAKHGTALPAFTGAQYAAAVKQAQLPTGFTKPGVTTVEGFLFPATYTLRTTASATDLVNDQLDAFIANTRDIDFSFAKSKHLTPYEVVIIASMIEREAQLPSERAKVAAVIYNRLKARMTLGIDATVQYVADPNVWKTELTESDLALDSPYNTRLKMGLPPTPIANPGKASLDAAAHPAKTDALYYVAKSDGSGGHYFTSSYDDFLAHQ